MGSDKCKRCGTELRSYQAETLIRIKITENKSEEVHLCQYCTRALDNFLNCNWRFDHG